MCNISFYAFAFLYVKISSVFNVMIISNKVDNGKTNKTNSVPFGNDPPSHFSQFFGIAAPWDFVFMHYKGKFDRHIFLFPPSALANIKLLQHLGHTSKLRDVGSIFITV